MELHKGGRKIGPPALTSRVLRRVARVLLCVAVVLAGLSVGAVTSSSADAASDEPDLLPFVGSYAVGCTWDNGCSGGHHGTTTPAVDFPMPEGVTVVAAGPGVARTYTDTCAGRYVEIWHVGVQKWSRYLHLSSFAIADGARVTKGQVIGRSGNTGSEGGCSTGAHLHYDEIDPSRRRVRPGPMVGRSGTAWTTYPQALGAADWNAVRAFGGPAVTNDFSAGSGGVTTVPPTAPTTRPPATTTTRPPATTAPPGSTTTVPRPASLVAGAVFKASDAPNVYLYDGTNAWWIPSMEQLTLFGGIPAIRTVAGALDPVLSSLPFDPLDDDAFVEAGNPQLYWCSGGSPWPVGTMDEARVLMRASGRTGWRVLPGGAGHRQWACGGTLPDTVFQYRGYFDFWVWRGDRFEYVATSDGLRARGLADAEVHTLPIR